MSRDRHLGQTDPDDRRLDSDGDAPKDAGSLVRSAERQDQDFIRLAAGVAGGAEAVTREQVERAGYDWHDWTSWIDELLDHQRRNQLMVAAYSAASATFQPPPTVEGRLGFVHHADSDLGRYWAGYWAEHPDEAPRE